MIGADGMNARDLVIVQLERDAVERRATAASRRVDREPRRGGYRARELAARRRAQEQLAREERKARRPRAAAVERKLHARAVARDREHALPAAEVGKLRAAEEAFPVGIVQHPDRRVLGRECDATAGEGLKVGDPLAAAGSHSIGRDRHPASGGSGSRRTRSSRRSRRATRRRSTRRPPSAASARRDADVSGVNARPRSDAESTASAATS